MEPMHYIKNFLDTIGYLGPIILLMSTLVLLKNKTTLLTYYTFGYILNIGMNVILKSLVQQPRPSENLHIFNASIANGKRIGFNAYGMPSGHTQTAFYSVGFIFFALGDPIITASYLLIALNTSYERIKYKQHTLRQVICGGIIGLVVGATTYLFSSKKLSGLLKYKKDDNAPI
jgi:membrane-associated phospholipid phosphatase